MLSLNFIILVAGLTIIKLVFAIDEIQLTDGIDEEESESIENRDGYSQYALEKKLQTEKTASHSTEINVKESDESLKVDIYGASSQNEKKYSTLSNEERANYHESRKLDEMDHSISHAYRRVDENDSFAIKSIEIIKPEFIFSNEGLVMGSKSSEDKSGFSQTDMGSTYQLNGITENILSASSRLGNNARPLSTEDSYEYSTQIGNKIYPVDKLSSLHQHIQSLYATNLFNPATYTAATQQNAGVQYLPSDLYRTLKSSSREKLSSDNVSDDADRNAYPYTPTYNQINPNPFRIGNPFNTQQRENAPNYYFLDQSQLKQPLSSLYQERLRRNANVAPVTNPLFNYYPRLIN